MSLLQALKLPVPAPLRAPGASSAPPVVPSVLPDKPERPSTKASGRAAAGDADDARAQATKLRGAIEAQRKQSADRLLRMQKIEPVLKAKVDAATGDEKKALAGKQALLAKEISAAERAVTRAEADLEAIDNPGSKREELLAILARQKAGGKAAESTEITAAGLDPYKKGKLNTDVTATTTSYAKGKATTESVRSQQKVGLDGYTKTDSSEKTVTDGQTTARSSQETKTNVSLGGKLSVEDKQSVEVQRSDGSKARLEVKKSKEISTKGASQTQTATLTKLDGSSTSKTSTQGVERGEGKVVATTSTSVTKTDASGTAKTTDKSASGGLVAGKNGMGAKGALGGGQSMTTKGGRHVGVVGGLHANVMCKVGEPTGEPKVYPVTVTVTFGGSAAVSGGMGKKEGSKISGSLEMKGSVERSMIVTHMLKEAQLADYTEALEAASKGNKVAATQAEFAIIATGVKEGWNVAREMWETGGKAITRKATDGLVNTGDSAQISETNTGGIAGKGKVGWVGGGYGVTDTKSSSTKVTRNETGGLDVETKQERGRQTDISASLDTGVVGLEMGTTHAHKTSFGYSISIDPKQDPDGKILAWLSQCKTEADYNVFKAANFAKIKVIDRTDGVADADADNVGVSVLGAKLQIGAHKGVAQETKTDGQGKVVGKKTVANAGTGGEVLGFADSNEDQAVAETDADGNATLTLTSTSKQNYGSRAREKKKQKQLEAAAAGKQGGALTTASGSGEDEDDVPQDVAGVKLTNKDLRRIGKFAANKGSWMGQKRRWQDEEDWAKARSAIVAGKGAPGAVSHALAEFIGTGAVERKNTVMLLVRGGYHSTMGKAFEFPDSLGDIRADYDLLSDDALPKKMDTYANKKGNAAAAKECQRLLAIVDRIQPRIQACKEFDNLATKTEMLSQMRDSRGRLNEAVQGYSGKLKPEDDPQVLADDGNQLMKLCNAYGVEQEKLVDLMSDQDAVTVSERADGKKLIKQLEDMQHRWWNDFYRLKDNYAKRKLALPEFPYVKGMPQFKPTEALVATFEKKFVR